MKIISWNVNGIRSVYRKKFLEWLEATAADIICLQEIKAQEEQISTIFPTADLFNSFRYHLYFHPARKKGYAGVAVLTTKKPIKVNKELDFLRFDQEGRFLELLYPEFTLFNLYLPHGGRQKENLAYKIEAYNYLLQYLKNHKEKNIILAGDFNVAHKEIDLAHPRANQNNTMFTPLERLQLDKIIELGFIDSFRKFNLGGGYYTWWPYSASARGKNLGWRIDYTFVSKNLASKLKRAFILSDTGGSDHCPIGIEI